MEYPPLLIYRLGTDFFSECYPIDDEIATQMDKGKFGIDTSFYRNFERQNRIKKHVLIEWDNFEMMYSEIRDHYVEDLEKVAAQGVPGAYTLIASVCDNYADQFRYFKMAAEGGSPIGMVDLGFVYGMEDKYTEAFEWLLKGAESGNEYGELLVGLSYEYGMYSPLDYDQAIYWYTRAMKEHKNGYAANNIGALYMQAGYYKTALRFFRKAWRMLRRKDIRDGRTSGAINAKLNAHRCRQVLRAPKDQQPFYFVLKQYATHTEPIFRIHHEEQAEPEHPFNDKTDKLPQWKPAPDCKDIQRELFMHKLHDLPKRIKSLIFKKPKSASLPKAKRKIDHFESIEMLLMEWNFVPNQHELIFIEKKVHGTLNHYLMENCKRLDVLFREKGFFLTYLPVAFQRNAESDIISYIVEDIQNVRRYFSEHKNRDTIAQFWNHTINTFVLPPDCAGFLHYNHERSIQKRDVCFDFIMIPFEPDVDYDYLFDHFIDYLAQVPLISLTPTAPAKEPEEKYLHTKLVIGEDYYFSLKTEYTNNTPPCIDTLKMPVLARVLYLTLLNHPEGIVLKQLPDYKEELMQLYVKMSNRSVKPESIDRLVDATSNSANEQIARIRQALRATGKYQSQLFAPQGIPGERYAVNAPREWIENHLTDSV